MFESPLTGMVTPPAPERLLRRRLRSMTRTTGVENGRNRTRSGSAGAEAPGRTPTPVRSDFSRRE
jgi:hypothetical protein